MSFPEIGDNWFPGGPGRSRSTLVGQIYDALIFEPDSDGRGRKLRTARVSRPSPRPAVRACGAEPVTTPQTPAWPPGAATRGASADPLSQGNDDPLWPANVGHAPDVLVLTDAADQAVAVRGQPVDRRLKVVDFK